MITLLNTSIATSHGLFSYRGLSLEEAKKLIKDNDWQSAIGHAATAEILSEILGIQVPVNRIQYQQGDDDIAVIFKLRERMPEGVILGREEVERIGYDLEIMKKFNIHSLPTYTFGCTEVYSGGYSSYGATYEPHICKSDLIDLL